MRQPRQPSAACSCVPGPPDWHAPRVEDYHTCTPHTSAPHLEVEVVLHFAQVVQRGAVIELVEHYNLQLRRKRGQAGQQNLAGRWFNDLEEDPGTRPLATSPIFIPPRRVSTLFNAMGEDARPSDAHATHLVLSIVLHQAQHDVAADETSPSSD